MKGSEKMETQITASTAPYSINPAVRPNVPQGVPTFLTHPDVFPDPNEPGLYRVRVCQNCQSFWRDCICGTPSEDEPSSCPIIYRAGEGPGHGTNKRLLDYLNAKHEAHADEKDTHWFAYGDEGSPSTVAEMRSRITVPQPAAEQAERLKAWQAEGFQPRTTSVDELAPVASVNSPASEITAIVPPTPPDRYALVPAELKALERWCVYKMMWQEAEKKFNKPPYNARTHKKGNPVDPKDRSSYQVACAALIGHPEYNGVGIAPEYADGLTSIDIDRCVTNRVIEPWAQKIVDELSTFTEFSPSGTGLRLWLKGWQVPIVEGKEGRNFGGIEIYRGRHYMTVTGDHVPGTPLTIERRDVTVFFDRCVLGEYNRKAAKTKTETSGDHKIQDSVQIEHTGTKLVPTTKLRLLMTGEITSLKPEFRIEDGHGNSLPYPSQSEADQALCNVLAIEHNGDAAAIDEQFRRSSLMREKWDRDDYRNGTIKKAIESYEKSAAKAAANAPIKLSAEDYATLTAGDEGEAGTDEPIFVPPSTTVETHTATPTEESEPELLSVLDLNITQTQRGIAEVIGQLFGHNYLYAIGEVKGAWHLFNGQVWRRADDAEMLSVVTKLSKRIRKLAAKKDIDRSQEDKLIQLANKLDNTVFPNGVVTHLKGIRKGYVQPDLCTDFGARLKM